MSIANACSRTAIESKSLDGNIEFVELFGEVDCPDKDLVPSASLVREGSETFRSDPFEETNIGLV